MGREMNVAVFGLGYVGVVSGACIADAGHRVIGVDPVQAKVDAINGGYSPIVEPGLSELIAKLVKENRLCATCDPEVAIATSEVIIVCVGTPSRSNGDIDLSYVHSVAAQIGEFLKACSDYRAVVIRSTVLPGSVLGRVKEILEEKSGKLAGVDFGLCFNPEFLREGTAISDFHQPPKTVIGSLNGDDRAVGMLKDLYQNISAPLIVTSIEVAEMVKYMDNTWHAVKVVFGNEIGAICKRLGIDSHEAIRIFVQDTKLNLSPYYLWPGFAFGGSCLPKDVRALAYRGRMADLKLPLLEHLISSNKEHIERAFALVTGDGRKRIGFAGLSFKVDTDDLRESPVVELVEWLIGKGYDVHIHDPDVQLAALHGANKQYILDRIGHIARLMVNTTEELLAVSDVIVLAKNDVHAKRAADNAKPDQHIVDLVRAVSNPKRGSNYDGICW